MWPSSWTASSPAATTSWPRWALTPQGTSTCWAWPVAPSENAKVVKDLLTRLAEAGRGHEYPTTVGRGRLPKALKNGIREVCGDDARVQRCQIHKIRNVSDRLPKERRDQVRWLMSSAFKLDAFKGRDKLPKGWRVTCTRSTRMRRPACWRGSVRCAPSMSWALTREVGPHDGDDQLDRDSELGGAPCQWSGNKLQGYGHGHALDGSRLS